MNLAAHIEAILFFKGEPITVSELATLTDTTVETVQEALDTLQQQLASHGIRVVTTGRVVTLATAPEASEYIDTLRRKDLQKSLGKAGFETVTIIAYCAPISRPAIDYIRGVNSTFMIRNLMVRGLIERTQPQGDARTYYYQPTTQLLQYLGVTEVRDLPNYDTIRRDLTTFATSEHANEGGSETSDAE
jgi:segregation and condensation protein B